MVHFFNALNKAIGDDLYFLRLLLMIQNGCGDDNKAATISKFTMETMLRKLNGIVRGEIVQGTHLDWIQDSLNSGKFWRFSKITQNELLDTLVDVAKNSTSEKERMKAESLYRKVIHIFGLSKANHH